MIIDIRYTDKGPEQIQGVRLTSVRITKNLNLELVIHFKDYRQQRNIPLTNVYNFTISND